MRLVILRGVSGSGKSTRTMEFIAEKTNNFSVCSADDYFMNAGVYVFNPSFLGAAHAACKNKARHAIKEKVGLIIIDNTNTQTWEFKDYVEMAKDAGYRVSVETIGYTDEDTIKEYAERNRHGVGLDVVRKQAQRFELFPCACTNTINGMHTYSFCSN